MYGFRRARHSWYTGHCARVTGPLDNDRVSMLAADSTRQPCASSDIYGLRMCRGLCRNPAIPTRITGNYSVSLCVTCRRLDVRQGRMDIGSPYHLLCFGIAPSDSGPRFDTVEVRSSSLLVPTISITK